MTDKEKADNLKTEIFNKFFFDANAPSIARYVADTVIEELEKVPGSAAMPLIIDWQNIRTELDNL